MLSNNGVGQFFENVSCLQWVDGSFTAFAHVWSLFDCCFSMFSHLPFWKSCVVIAEDIHGSGKYSWEDGRVYEGQWDRTVDKLQHKAVPAAFFHFPNAFARRNFLFGTYHLIILISQESYAWPWQVQMGRWPRLRGWFLVHNRNLDL